MVLAHNIEQSNDYLIPSKNTTDPKCGFSPRFLVQGIGPRFWSEVFGPRYWFELLV